MKLQVAVVVLLLPSLAIAEPAPEAPTALIGVNAPINWEHSVGISISVAVTEHQALRGNFMRHDHGVLDFALFALADAEDEASYRGATTDVGVSWVYYPRAVFDGFFVEAGALYRRRDTTVTDDDTSDHRDTHELAGRAQIGWSWLISRRASIAVALGGSYGYEFGTDTTAMTSSHVSRGLLGPEGMMRFGVAF